MRALVWGWCAAPLVHLAWLAYSQSLGANPQEALLRALGQHTLMLLLLIVSLPVLAARLPAPWGGVVAPLLSMRRMLGLWAFTYTLVHLLAFWQFDHGLVLNELVQDALVRPFVALGLLATLLLLPLALTSFRRAQQVLGPQWKRLHWLVWPATGLGVVHYAMHKAGKNDFMWPVVAGLLWLLLYLLSSAQRVRAQQGRRTIRARPRGEVRPRD